MPTLSDLVDLLHGWYPPETAREGDAVGLVAGEPVVVVCWVLFVVVFFLLVVVGLFVFFFCKSLFHRSSPLSS